MSGKYTALKSNFLRLFLISTKIFCVSCFYCNNNAGLLFYFNNYATSESSGMRVAKRVDLELIKEAGSGLRNSVEMILDRDEMKNTELCICMWGIPRFSCEGRLFLIWKQALLSLSLRRCCSLMPACFQNKRYSGQRGILQRCLRAAPFTQTHVNAANAAAVCGSSALCKAAVHFTL